MGKHLSTLKSEAMKCSRCGSCQTVCPIHEEHISEVTCARGKVFLVRSLIDGNMAIDKEFEQFMSQCLMCSACSANCASGVPLPKLVEAARADVVDELGLHPIKKLIFRLVLKNRWIFELGMKSGSIFQKLLFRPGPNGEGMLPRLPIGLDRRRLLRGVADKSLRSQYPELVKAEKSKGTIAFFTGCMLNYIYVDAGKAVVEVLTKSGYDVLLVPEQICCGTPARVSGDYDTAKALAKANIDAFENAKVDTIVVACASCGAAWKEEFAELLKDDAEYHDKAREAAKKVKDFSEFIVEIEGWDKGLREQGLAVTYHDPCHLARGQNIRRQPREIISRIPGVQLTELSNKERCCGSAGSYALSHYDTAKLINDKKCKDIKETGAEVLVTACPACMMHIQDGLNRNGLNNVRCLHLAELLNMSMGQPPISVK